MTNPRFLTAETTYNTVHYINLFDIIQVEDELDYSAYRVHLRNGQEVNVQKNTPAAAHLLEFIKDNDVEPR